MKESTLFLAALLFISFITISFQTEATDECIDRGIDCWCKASLCRNAAYATLMNRQCCETCTRVNGTAAAAARRTGRKRRLSGFARLFLYHL
uniref:ShKT domain-containing protein n=1 Tax=Panagrolaimus sp. ES5 TaxID=591445 RepID=A0AC34FRF2_9BILA